MINKKINICLITFLFFFILLNVYISINFITKENIKKDIIRIHVVSNSDLIQDKIIKLKVYEKVNNFIKNLNIKESLSTTEALNIIASHHQEILDICNNTLIDNEKNYTATLKIGKIYYDEKHSVLLDMPNSSYNSVQIVLGNGNGENIWSLIFPNETNIKNLSNLETILPGISNIYSNFSSDTNTKTYSFKILEVLKKILLNNMRNIFLLFFAN